MDIFRILGPQMRLEARGASALTDSELLEVIAGAGPEQVGRLLGGELLGLLTELDVKSPRLSHLSANGRCRVLAAVELGRRLVEARLPLGDMINRPETMALYISAYYWNPDQEVMGALYFNSQHRLLATSAAYRGGRRHAVEEPRVAMTRALLVSACEMVLFHTHPGGYCRPSKEDEWFTGRVREACQVLGIEFHGHLVVGRGGEYERVVG